MNGKQNNMDKENFNLYERGLGIVTCNRSKYLEKCLKSIADTHMGDIDYIVLVNDGEMDVDESLYSGFVHEYIHNSENLGVGKSKNILLKKMLDKGCENIFIIEDDCIIKDTNVFEQYIKTSKKSGILHLCYGPGSPLNLKQDNNVDIYNRDKLSTILEPDPKLIIDYGNDIGVSLYQHCVGMFCYFHRSVLEKVGLFDETYYNVWEHVDHTYEIIKAGFHPPFWWFADIKDSDKYLSPVDDNHIKNSVIALNKEKWGKNVEEGMHYFIKKHGVSVGHIRCAKEEEVITNLRKIKNNRAYK